MMSAAKPEISVIIPTYARAADTARAVRSALTQDVDLEVIVVDDASPEAFTYGDDARVRVLRLTQNAGPAAGRNRGADAARGAWIAFLDSDDVWPADTLRPRLDAARTEDDGAGNTIWAAGFVYVSLEGALGETRIPRASARPLDFASGCWMCPGSTALMSRAAWDRSGGQNESLRRLEDYEWLLRWGAGGGHLAVHRAVAAQITRGQRARAALVKDAAACIRALHATQTPALRQRMEAYLQLEIAAALLHEGALVGGVAALARSWLLSPRLRPALEQFWD